MSHFGTPGVGGSLGMCALCGKPFLAEILLGKSVKSFDIGTGQTLYGHNGCLERWGGELDVMDLPTESPLRQAYEKRIKTATP